MSKAETMLTDKERLKRLEDIAVLLCQEALAGMGLLGRPYTEFIDVIRQERWDSHADAEV